MEDHPIVWPETTIFLGAGATSKLKMPTSAAQGNLLFALAQGKKDDLTLLEADPSVQVQAERTAELLKCLDWEPHCLGDFDDKQLLLLPKLFPNIPDESRRKNRMIELRRDYDWSALKTAISIVSGGSQEVPELFIQSLFNFLDVHILGRRGIKTWRHGGEIFLTPERLTAARQCLVMFINHMFACAWYNIVHNMPEVLTPYKKFTDVLAELMQEEGEKFWNDSGHDCSVLNKRKFYLFSYSILTTNFEPVFLWLLYNSHLRKNKTPKYVGSPALPIKLFYDFPNNLAMREPAEFPGGDLMPNIWYPANEGSVQRLNDSRHTQDRILRIGKYYSVHGFSNTRLCPYCKKLNIHVGDSWGDESMTLFPPGIIQDFSWGARARTGTEEQARERGVSDALQCAFCGHITEAKDNYMVMQTSFKGGNPAFIEEITAEALAMLQGTRHIVLLGYSLPPDDAIWRSILSAMKERKDRKVYCSVVCGHDGPDRWLRGDELQNHVNENKQEDKQGAKAIQNAIDVFGLENVRAYTAGIPDVFKMGDKKVIKDLLYPHFPGWDLDCFENGMVVRK